MNFPISQGHAIRSVFGRSLVTHFICFSFRWLPRSRRLPTEQQCTLAVLVEAVEEWPRESEQLFVVADHREAAQEHVEPRCLGRVVALVGEVCLVHDLPDLPQHRVGELVTAQEGLETAVAAVVRELRAAHIEWGRVSRYLIRVVDENELRLWVEKALDEPRTAGPVDVAVAASRPPHP